MKACFRSLQVCSVLFLATAGLSSAARFAETIVFQQPRGGPIELHGTGNEFYAVFETVDGYTVVFDNRLSAYCYAVQNENGTELVSTGMEVGGANPDFLGVPRHVRITSDAVEELATRAKAERDSRLRIPERWSKLKAVAQRQEQSSSMLRYGPTVGTKVGLTLLIDFDDVPGSVPRGNIVQFLNGDGYRLNGNNGSVKEYFRDVSDGKLLYTNIVIGYIRIPRSVQPRTYYNDLNQETSLPVNELIRDAIIALTNQPNYMSEVVPQLEALSLDEAGSVLALNVFVAGSDSGVWAKGLWPHMGNLNWVGPQELWPGGKRVNMYQMTTMSFDGSAPQIGVFCHETGHLLCGFPDIYDYDRGSTGGAGMWCLMSNQFATNPQHPGAYLKLMAGWASVTDVPRGPATNITLYAAGTNGNHFLRYKPDLFGREYYLIENRSQFGRDAQLPGAGILIWHIDELGDNSNESLLPNTVHANYEVTLVQADNRWDFQRNQNSGDSTDPFYGGNSASGYRNRFSATTSPGASWWNGERTWLHLSNFSVRGRSMTLTAEVTPQAIRRDPLSQSLVLGDTLLLSVQMTTNQPYFYAWRKGGVALNNDGRILGADGPVLSISDFVAADAGQYTVVVSDSAGYQETSRIAQVTFSNLKPFASVDIGDALAMGGTSKVINNAYQITAAGSGILGSADSCRLNYEKVFGDFDVRVLVSAIKPEDASRGVEGGAGLMVRESLEASSPQVSVIVRPGFLDQGNVRAFTRPSKGASLERLAHGGGIPEQANWVRLKREGSVFTTYYSTNGSRWDWLQSVSVSIGEEAFVGMAVSSYHPTMRNVATLRSYTLSTNAASTYAISTVKSSVVEGSDTPARLMVVGSRNGPVEVTINPSNPAANGVLYERVEPTLLIPEGTNKAFIDIKPINNETSSAPAVVSLSVVGAGVAQSSANIIILDDDSQGQGLLKELYSGVPGTSMADLTNHYRYPGSCGLMTVASFESQVLASSGQALSGFIMPPETGEYVFYVASANASQLWLSLDSSPERAMKIAEELGMNSRRNWPGYGPTSHISMPVLLEKGRWYFVKALHKGGLNSPNFAVNWKVPGGEAPVAGSAPISGEYLTWTLPEKSGGSGGRVGLGVSEEGRLMLSFEQAAPLSWILQASEDLSHWTPISTNTLTQIDLLSVDPEATNQPQRFYRVLIE